MRSIETIIIGGGQAGLAMSRTLTDHGIEHVVLEKGRVGERWRSERWDSMTLLTPRWLSRLSGWADDDSDPHGFMSRHELIDYLERYASAFVAPVLGGVTVLDVRRGPTGFEVQTDRGSWRARSVVVATGESQEPWVPTVAEHLAPSLHQVTTREYKNPDRLPAGGVLVVGASATGIQLAQEIHASGRPVTLSVSKHTRLPRRYRGRDILWWMHHMGLLDTRTTEVKNLAASRAQPSMQLVGTPDHRTLDLKQLHAVGVRLVGRTESARGGRVFFADDLVESLAAAEMKLAGLRTRIDGFIREEGMNGDVPGQDPFVPVPMPDAPTSLDLRAEGIRSVLWATGFRRSYPWLRVPVLDQQSEIEHDGGVTAEPGLYVLGLNFMRRRSSSFLAGVSKDAEDLAEHLLVHRTERQRRRIA